MCCGKGLKLEAHKCVVAFDRDALQAEKCLSHSCSQGSAEEFQASMDTAEKYAHLQEFCRDAKEIFSNQKAGLKESLEDAVAGRILSNLLSLWR